jgi:hypothetical protein
MRRQIGPIRIWLALGSFFVFSICLPLGHVCLNQDSYANPALASSYPDSHGQDRDWRSSSIDESHKNDICQACLLAQNLFLDHGHIEMVAARTISSTLDRIYVPVIAITDFFQSASKRAPPACA